MINQEGFISSYKFARISNLVYSEVLTLDQFYVLNPKNIEILSKDNVSVFYKKVSFEVKDNDVIFTNTNLINDLFSELKKIRNLKNITLITNQTDDSITKKTYFKKPNSVSNWYAINVQHKANDLVPIPLGLANDYSPKNLRSSDFLNVLYEKKELPTMYVNFRENTNLKARKNLKDYFSDEHWVEVDISDLSIENYLKKLSSHSFTLCPWGNGIDTHRIWEALYAGSVPITKNHNTFSNLNNLPILFVNDYKEINYDLLKNYLERKNDGLFEIEKLNFKYWEEVIKSNNIDNKINSYNVTESIRKQKNIKMRLAFNSKVKSVNKKILFYIRKVSKIPSKILKTRY